MFVPPKNDVTKLNEWCQKNKCRANYELLRTEGPQHAATYYFKVTAKDISAEGQAPTKQKAKQEAAKALLDSILNSGVTGAVTAIDQINKPRSSLVSCSSPAPLTGSQTCTEPPLSSITRSPVPSGATQYIKSNKTSSRDTKIRACPSISPNVSSSLSHADSAYDTGPAGHCSVTAIETKSPSTSFLSFTNKTPSIASSTDNCELNTSTISTCPVAESTDSPVHPSSSQQTVLTDSLTPTNDNSPKPLDQQPTQESLQKKQLYKNAIAALKLIPSVMKEVFSLACPKNDPNESYMECLKKTKRINAELLSNDYEISIAGIGKLEKSNDGSEFDASLLYGLIRALWDKEAESTTSKVSKINDNNTDGQVNANKIEQEETNYLRRATKLRNEFCHGDKLVVSSSAWFEEMTNTLDNLIHLCGKRYSLDDVHINKQKSKLRCDIENLDNREHEIKQNFCQQARSEAKSLWEEVRPMIGIGFDPVDPIHRHDIEKSIFVPLSVMSRDTDLAESNLKSSCMTSTDTFLNTSQNQLQILTGEAGSGKTTVLKMIALHFFGLIKQEEVTSLDEFDLLHYLDCRNNKTENIKDFVKENFPNAYRDSDVEDEFDCFCYFRNLILIDGYDQCNEFSLKLVYEMVREIRSIPHCKIILTSRFNKSQDLEYMLNNDSIAYCHNELVEINSEEDQLQFLKAYWHAASSEKSYDAFPNDSEADASVTSRSSTDTTYTGGFSTNVQKDSCVATPVPSEIIVSGPSAITATECSSVVSYAPEESIVFTNHLNVSDSRTIPAASEDNSKTNGPPKIFVKKYGPECLSNNALVSSSQPHSPKVLQSLQSNPSQTNLSQYAPSQTLLDTSSSHTPVNLSNSAFPPVPSLDEFVEKFNNLAKEVKEFFVRPLYLAFLFHLLIKSPATVTCWNNPNDIMIYIINQHKSLIEKKLKSSNPKALIFLVGKLMHEVYRFAFDCFMKDKTSVEKEELEKLQNLCQSILDQQKSVISIDVLDISALFLKRSMLKGAHEVDYQFNHKSVLELMASRWLSESLTKGKDVPFKEILFNKWKCANMANEEGGNEKRTTERLLNLIRLVVMELSSSPRHERSIGLWFPQITEIRQQAGIRNDYWFDLVASCPNSKFVAKTAAEVCSTEDVPWVVRTPREVFAVSKMLEHNQPNILNVTFERNSRIPASLKDLFLGIERHFRGKLVLNLEHSYWNYVPCDDFLVHLGSSVCCLVSFRGCLGTSLGAVQVLADMAENNSDGPLLFISLAEPETHQLAHFHNNLRRACVRVRPTDRARCSPITIPFHCTPRLVVDCSPIATATDTVDAILSMAQLVCSDFQFSELHLQKWPHEDATLAYLHKKLSDCNRWNNISYHRLRLEPHVANQETSLFKSVQDLKDPEKQHPNQPEVQFCRVESQSETKCGGKLSRDSLEHPEHAKPNAHQLEDCNLSRPQEEHPHLPELSYTNQHVEPHSHKPRDLYPYQPEELNSCKAEKQSCNQPGDTLPSHHEERCVSLHFEHAHPQTAPSPTTVCIRPSTLVKEDAALGMPVLVIDLNSSPTASGTDFSPSSTKPHNSSSSEVISTSLTNLTSSTTLASTSSLEIHSTIIPSTGTVTSSEPILTGTNSSTEAQWPTDNAQVDRSLSVTTKSVPVTTTAHPFSATSSVSTSSLPLPGASPDQEQLYRNAVGSFDIMPGVLRELVQWVSTEKEADETFMEFLRKKKISRKWLKEKVGIRKDGLEMLESDKNCRKMDVPLLYGLIRACGREKLADCSDPVWGVTKKQKKGEIIEPKLDTVSTDKNNETTPEILLKKSYELRNAFCHGDKSSVTSSDWFGEMKGTLNKLICAFGELTSIGSDVIEKERARLIDEICKLGRKSRVKSRIENFREKAYQEAKEYWKEQRVFDAVPFDQYHLNQKRKFHPIDIPLREGLRRFSPEETIRKIIPSYRDILDDSSDTERTHFTILIGEAGSGKTTLSRMIALQFFEVIDREMISLTEFDLLYYLECRTHKLRKMKNFISENFPISHKNCEIEDELDCFRYLRNLIIIDGFDECNESSYDLIIEIIHKIKSMSLCKVIMTSRPFNTTYLEDLLVSENIQFQTFELMEINEEERQLEFLKTYWNSTNHEITAEKGRSLATQNAHSNQLFSQNPDGHNYSLPLSDQSTRSNEKSSIGTSEVISDSNKETVMLHDITQASDSTGATKTSNEITSPAVKLSILMSEYVSTESTGVIRDLIPESDLAEGTRNSSDITFEHIPRASNDLVPSRDGMLETFKDLHHEVKDFFVRPINLVMFHYLYSFFPDTVQNWTHPTDVTRHIMKMYENSIANKFEILGLSTSTDLGRRLMYEVNQFAFQCLANDQLTLTDMDLEELETNCYEILYENKKVLEFDLSVILSVILLVRVAPTPTGRRTYQFFHKSIQELMASQSLVNNHCNDEQSLKVVFLEKAGLTRLLSSTSSGRAGWEEIESIERFLNVILFVVMELSADANQELILQRRFPEIVEVLKMARVDFDFWAELVASCPTSNFVAKATAKSCAGEEARWLVHDSREVSAVSRMLEHDQPGFLSVRLGRSVRTPASLKQLLVVIGTHFSGQLILKCEDSYWNHVPLDDYLHNLHKAGCRITDFKGCLAGKREAATALAECAHRCNDGYFFISLAPSKRHQLLILEYTRHNYWFRVRAADFDCSRRRHLMLPHGGGNPPRLTVVCSSETGVKQIAQLIDSLRPMSDKYQRLCLQNCYLDDSALEALLKDLTKRSLHTVAQSSEVTQWWPVGTNPEGNCFVCEENEHKPGERCVHLFLKQIILALPGK